MLRPKPQRAVVALTCSAWTALLLAACHGGGGAPDSNPPGDTTPPTITTVFPVNSAADVAVNATVLATFSEIMNAATLTTTTFSLTVAATGASVAGSVAVSGTTATYSPATALATNTAYRASITTGARDAAGNALTSAHTWSFTTTTAADTTPPTVTSVAPANGASEVPTTTTVRAVYSDPMNATTLDTSTFSVVQTSSSAAVGGSINVAGDTATYTPSGPLAISTHYTATVGTGTRDLAGN